MVGEVISPADTMDRQWEGKPVVSSILIEYPLSCCGAHHDLVSANEREAVYGNRLRAVTRTKS